MTSILTASRVSKSFLLAGHPNLILDEVNFSLREGDFVSIVGPSGCGKSTFLELLAGITKPDSGNIVYRGTDITGASGHLGYMPQDDLLFPWLDLSENILLPVRVKKGDLKAARRRISELLPEFGLAEHSRHLPYQLSGGLKQRAAFLRTYMTGASVLLLDEPFASLDAITRKQMQAWLKEITSRLGTTVILVTHDISEAIFLSGKVHLMRSKPGTFIQEYQVAQFRQRGEAGLNELKQEIMSGLQIPVDPLL